MKKIDRRYIRTIIPALLIAALLFGAVAYLQLITYKSEIEKQKKTAYQIAGAGAEGDLPEQIASEILKGELDDKQEYAGRAILRQYGFTDDYKTQYDRQWKSLCYQTLIRYGLLYFIAAALFFMISVMFGRQRRNELEVMEEALRSFHDGNYDIEFETDGEDIIYKINSTMEALGKYLRLKDESLIREKEETKTLVTDISHQLKTPIASIKMCYSLLNDEQLEPEERQEFMYRLRDQIDHLELLTQALINISRMETGMIKIQKENHSILETITNAINQVYLKADAKNITINLETSSDNELETLKLPHDSKWTAEAVANVLDNGIKYSASGSMLTIRVMKQINYLRIEIEDQGIGIAEEEYHQIFKRFYRGKSEVVSKAEGSGVGLYLTRKILEEQGGSITVTSRTDANKKSGSTFIILLCLA